MRAFLAIDLPEKVQSELESLQNSLSLGRPVPSENFHLTLSFLGEQPEDAIQDAHEALSTIEAGSFDLRLIGVGTFGGRSPNVVFADVTQCEKLIELERRITRALRNAGVRFQKRRFRPHVTIARLPRLLSGFELAKLRDYMEEHAAFRSSRFDVQSFQLYRSTLTPSGARHEALASYELQTGDPSAPI